MNPEPVKLRKDGWPLCPKCGDDELASGVIIGSIEVGWDHEEVMAGTFFCYACRWEGHIKLPLEYSHAE